MGWGEFVPATSSSVMTRTVKCSTCGYQTNLCNLHFNYEAMTANAVCVHCRQPIKEADDG